ncbi:hypothetical protein [Pseudomonas folii]|uniref:Lipoprotein n=1 Tax=Pseudomonas folii TaxID=2762593 RepID=A0ABR7B7A1_9PSED|nr:hypothetical protein [Pseudomonas folii]MBC3953049.1 hypothetical protein [Pseudomonas folii]
MKQTLIAVLFLLALSGCATWPGSAAREKVWYAETEQPQLVPWHAYLTFTDDTHFIYWRTVEDPDAVLSKFDEYIKGDGADVDAPIAITRTGDRFTAESHTPLKSRTGELVYTTVNTFNGRFIGDTLEVDFQTTTVWPDRPAYSYRPIRWSMKRLSTL